MDITFSNRIRVAFRTATSTIPQLYIHMGRMSMSRRILREPNLFSPLEIVVAYLYLECQWERISPIEIGLVDVTFVARCTLTAWRSERDLSCRIHILNYDLVMLLLLLLPLLLLLLLLVLILVLVLVLLRQWPRFDSIVVIEIAHGESFLSV